MKKVFSFLSSTQLMAVIMGLFFISIASATFIENDFGPDIARILVYNAPWFNAFLLLGMVNLLSVIISKKLYRKGKLTLFIFHAAFVLILFGAGITRFIGYEGTMSIREGESSDIFLQSHDRLTMSALNDSMPVSVSKPVRHSLIGSTRLHLRIPEDKGDIELKLNKVIPNAKPSVEPFTGGIPMAELVISGPQGRETLIVKKGERYRQGSLLFSFNENDADSSAILLFPLEEGLYFKAAFPVEQTSMSGHDVQLNQADSLHRIEPMQLYRFNGSAVVLTRYYPQARITALPPDYSQHSDGSDAALVKVTKGDAEQDFWVWKNMDGRSQAESILTDNTVVRISYGPRRVKLPFSLFLKDFIIERYPGSNSPSWFESSIILQDGARGIVRPDRIYMNHVLRYKGYRFYQSSYDEDEKGTILTVSHDLAGTLVTYAGYFLMALGMAFSLFNRNSRFRLLLKETKSIRMSRHVTGFLLFLMISWYTGYTQTAEGTDIVPVDKLHASEFGQLLIQDQDGRIEPINTLASGVLRKLCRKDAYKGMNADQVFLGMLINPDAWQYEPIIRTRHPQIQDILKSDARYYSFASFFSGTVYILQPYVEEAYRKKPAYRNKFDNEIIRLDERVNVAYLVFTGHMLRIFPRAGDSTQTWYSPVSSRGQFETEDSVFVENVISLYAEEGRKSLETGNWEAPAGMLNAMKKYQQHTGSAIIPSKGRIRLEIMLNKSNVFDRISLIYGLVGFLLLIYQFAGLFYSRIRYRGPVWMAAFLIGLLFIVHTLGLAARWYVSGHAPWSNGYEALLYIAWASVLAGIVFARRSPITLSVTSVLAYLILHTAHLSWMDPQITSLVPVLKSYWLVIHVATITASYGFLALGALLAFINLLLMFFQNRRNYTYIDLSIRELTAIIEMALIIGLYLLTIGTFLGGVWANESWGRYWGWDPKETWALATIIVYAFIGHMRLVKGLSGVFGFNLASLLGFSSVIMTYFGVNYYLSGLHSYAKGDPVPVHPSVYYTLMIVALVAIAAYINHRRLNINQPMEDAQTDA